MPKARINIKSRTSRRSLPVSPKLYIEPISGEPKLAVGYRKGKRGGTWSARYHDGGMKYTFHPIGAADDSPGQADGVRVFSFEDAVAEAKQWKTHKAAEEAGEVKAGPYTVADTMADYLKDRERVRRKTLNHTRSTINAHILPALGQIQLTKLTHGRVKAWRDSLAEAKPRVRRKPDAAEPAFREIDANDPETIRKRQATVNRVFTVLKAALNHAFKEGRIANNGAWARIRAFREVDVAKVRYLSVDECKRLIEKSSEDFRAVIRAALYTGCRYGELTAMRVDAFNFHAGTIHVVRSKSGKGRYIPLTDEGAAFFRSITANRPEEDWMFTHKDGRRKEQPWEPSQQRWWMQLVCDRAEISPIIGFHILRHTYASQLAMNGTPMPVIAALLGHADTRMTEKHYGHLAPSYVAETLRANLPSFGFVPPPQGPMLVERVAANA